MKQSCRLAPPNSIFFIEDAAGGELPLIDGRAPRIWASQRGIIVGCLSFMDGETEFTASDSADDAARSVPTFSGEIATPGRLIEVSTSEREVLLRIPVAGATTRVRIWTNHPSEPNEILAVFG